jgi:hypothetical protein
VPNAATQDQVEQNQLFMRLLEELETRFAVDEWMVDSVRVWPIARMQLYYGFFEYQYFADRPARAGLLATGDLPRVGRRVIGGVWDYVRAGVTDFARSQHRNRPHDVVVLNYQTYMTLLQGRWYSRVCDPFVELLTQHGSSAMMLTAGYKCATPRFTRSRFIQPHLVMHRLFGMLRRPALPEAAMLDELEKHARASGLFAPSFQLINPVHGHARQVIGIAQYFRRVLAKLRPKMLIVSCWYSTESMACLLAAHALGIPTIDIQHGSQEFHVAYDGWHRFPAGGYELLPAFFWCWSATEAAVIAKWSSHLPVHQPMVGGNLFLERWLRGDDDTVREYDRLIGGMKSRNGAAVQILYTLNGSTKDEVDRVVEIISAANESGLNAFFWLRLHPIALDQRERIEGPLQRRGLRNFDVGQATALPLYALLRHIDVHMTEFSSVVIEAQAFGVPSVTGEQGVIWFPGQVASGWALMGTTPREWVDGARRQLERREALRAQRHQEPMLSTAGVLEQLSRVRAVAQVPGGVSNAGGRE